MVNRIAGVPPVIEGETGTPVDYGMPERFLDWEWREGQQEAVDLILDPTWEHQKRIVNLCAPTGTGKTLVNLCAAKYAEANWPGQIIPGGGDPLPARTAIVTMTKALQDQVVEENPDCGLFDVRGRSNYQCVEFPGESCEHGYDHGCHLNWRNGCPYAQVIEQAKHESTIVINYASWTRHHTNGRRQLGHFNLLLCDEAHDIEDAICSAVEVVIFKNEYPHSNQPIGDRAFDAAEWYGWAADTLPQYESWLRQTEAMYEQEKSRANLRNVRRLRKKVDKLVTIERDVDPGWAVDYFAAKRDEPEKWVMQPVWAREYAERSLYVGVERVGLLSGTLTPKAVELAGANLAGQHAYWELPSSFPPDRNPLIHVPTMRMDYKTANAGPQYWVSRVDALINDRLDRKGIIQVTSYELLKAIIAMSQHGKRIIYHHDSRDQKRAVEQFRRAGPGAVLLSPSVSTGLDFPDDLCRYQIIPRIPYPPTKGSAVMERRRDEDRDYQNHVMCQKLIQMCGRGGRSADDWCENLVIDDRIEWMFAKMRDLMPKYFPPRYRRAGASGEGRGLPKPPRLAA